MGASGSASRPQVSLGHLIEEALGLELHVEAGILACLGAGESRDALHKIKHRRRCMALFDEHGFDDLGRIGLREAALAQEVRAVLVRSRHNLGSWPLSMIEPGASLYRAGEPTLSLAAGRDPR